MGSNPTDDEGNVPIVVEFTSVPFKPFDPPLFLISSRGGLELLFSNQRKHHITLPSTDENGQSANMAFLVRYLCKNIMADKRKDMFVIEGTVLVVSYPSVVCESSSRADEMQTAWSSCSDQ